MDNLGGNEKKVWKINIKNATKPSAYLRMWIYSRLAERGLAFTTSQNVVGWTVTLN